MSKSRKDIIWKKVEKIPTQDDEGYNCPVYESTICNSGFSKKTLK